jgi:hypothetical protein
MKTTTPWSRVILIAILLGSIATGVAMAASSASLLNYQVDFVEVTGEGESRVWTYALTSNDNVLADLSSWTLSIDSACGYKFRQPAVPAPGIASYTTPTSYVLQTGQDAGTDICSGTYSCQAATYDVVQSLDNSVHQRSINFSNPDQALSSTNLVTHLFQIEIESPSDHRIGDASVTVDTGTGGIENGQVSGAVCPPTAVQLVNLSASSHPASPAIFIFLLAAGVAILSGWIINRRAKVA